MGEPDPRDDVAQLSRALNEEIPKRVSEAWEAAAGEPIPEDVPTWDEPAGWTFEPLPAKGGVLELLLRGGDRSVQPSSVRKA